MHLHKLIDHYEKLVMMYNHHTERAVLENLCRLRYLEDREPLVEIEPLVLSSAVLAAEIGTNANPLALKMRHDKTAPKPVPSPTGKNNHVKYYVRADFYKWWNHKQNLSAPDSV